MAEAPAHTLEESRQIEPMTARVIAGAGIGEMLGGGGAVVLSIIALAGVLPHILLSIAGLCVGGALLFEGGSIATRYRQLLDKFDIRIDMAELGGGMSAEFVGGAAGVVLGLLSLLGVYPAMLMPVAAIVFGGALVIGAAATSELKTLTLPRTEHHERVRMVARQAVASAAGLQVLGGLGTIVLGILALVNAGPSLMLSLVAFLTLGGVVLLSGSAIGGKMLSIFQH